MGLFKREGKIFLKIKEGKFYKTSDKNLEDPSTDLEGRLVDIGIRNDTFNGKPLEKLDVTVDGGDGLYGFSIPFESAQASKFIMFLKSADLMQPLTFSPSYKKDGEKEDRVIFVKQNGQNLKSFYTKDNPNGLPPMKKLKSGKWNKEDFTEFLRNVVLSEFKPSLSTKVVNTPEPIEVPNVESEDDDTLPF